MTLHTIMRYMLNNKGNVFKASLSDLFKVNSTRGVSFILNNKLTPSKTVTKIVQKDIDSVSL